MASNHFGNLFRIVTWGESHGKAIGVVIDGCPAGLALSEEDIAEELKRRAPGTSPYTSARKEPDIPEILSGVFEGKTTGAPISIIIPNRDVDSSKYEAMKDLLRPGHAQWTYLQKYGIFDYRGGGRASARETVARVAAGAVAKKFLHTKDIEVHAELVQVGEKRGPLEKLLQYVAEIQKEGDSIGGIIEFVVSGLPPTLGDPIYEKLEANLAKALLSLPATKGFEIGEGFYAAALRGSEHNDLFQKVESKTVTQSNHCGGTLGGISTGMPLTGSVAFKPASSIYFPQKTITLDGHEAEFALPKGSRHDPCVAIRAVPIVEAMVALVLADALLMDRISKI